MRIPHYMTRTLAGYAFRCRVPSDLQARVGCKVIKRSLHTKDKRDAQGAAFLLGSRYARAFDYLRKEAGMTEQEGALPSLDEVIEKMGDAMAEARIAALLDRANKRQVGDHNLRELKMGMGPNGPFLETESGDSPEIVAQAMKTVEAWIDARVANPVPPPRPQVAAYITATEALARYLASIKPTTKPKTFSIKKAAVEGFVEHYTKQTPKRQIADANRADVADWVAFLRNNELSTPTIVNKLSYLKGFFNFLTGAGFYPAGHNPAQGQAKYGAREKRLRRKHGFRALTLEEVKTLFAPEALEKLSPEARWGALIGLYTGARVAEVGQLAVPNFYPLATTPFLHFTDKGKGQSLKTDASDREIPLHDDLLALGILDRVQALKEAEDLRFFPNVAVEGVNGAGNWLSKAFARHLKEHGLESEKDGAKVGFHSLRKTVVQTMQGARVVADVRAQYVGHEIEDEHRGTYSRRLTLEEMKQAVNPALAYGLDLEGIKQTLGNAKRRRRKA